MKITCLSRQKHVRDDGWLAELISMVYPDHPFSGVHTYVVSITPGRTRANHYHKKKEEWLALAAGTVTLHLVDTRTGEHRVINLESQSADYGLIYIPPFIAHSLKNTGTGEAAVIVFSRTPEDTADTIPFPFEA
jgi:oxalate decarboxylase/phosphoglucose isomerase-like protein (cupin superfamily)